MDIEKILKIKTLRNKDLITKIESICKREEKKNDTQDLLIEILAKLHTMPYSFPKRESDEYNLGYSEALRDVRHLLKEYILTKNNAI